MIAGLPLGFAEPLVLIGLLTLPVLWWLLRLMPPRPRRIEFPPTRLLLEIAPKEETPARTPWWLTLIRLALAALVIIAAAGPMWNPPVATTKTRAPVAILIDDGWAAAASWDARLRTADDIIARADNDRRAVALIPLSEGTRDISFATAAAARVRLHQIKPKPHTVDRTEALAGDHALPRRSARCGNGVARRRHRSRPRHRFRQKPRAGARAAPAHHRRRRPGRRSRAHRASTTPPARSA